ncbi:hypothetical protein GW17_00025631 [Ensete ventricosum]|nr:hypothetical protein GW17_00025631 [Ensete ventricosum]
MDLEAAGRLPTACVKGGCGKWKAGSAGDGGAGLDARLEIGVFWVVRKGGGGSWHQRSSLTMFAISIYYNNAKLDCSKDRRSKEAFNGITQGVISSRADSALSEGTSGTLMAVGAVGHHLLPLSHLVESTIVGCLPRVTFASASSFPGRGLMPASSFREVMDVQ